MFQCSKCCITLSSHEELKNHCSCKWHAYNLMRATQARSPITLQAFEALARDLLSHKQSINEQVTLSCIPCNKTFSSEGTFGSHLQSRSHKTRAANFSPVPTPEQHGVDLATQHHSEERDEPTWDGTRSVDLSDLVEDDNSSESDGSWEELSEEEEETFLDSNAAPEFCPCLLCPVTCLAAPDTLQHMRKEHSFTVPHREACNLRSLYTRLAYTVRQLRRCPQCGRQFLSVAAVQRHMSDKSHLTINPLSKQYRRCYRAALFASRLELPRTSPDACVFELTLDSGARLTPRSLALFTRQRLRPEALDPRVRQRRLALQEATRQTSRALQTTAGYKGSLHKQQVAECRHRAPERLSVATRANALRHRFRAQVERAG